MSADFVSILSPHPASMSRVHWPRTSSGRIPMRIRFLASGGATRSQRGFGTTPNIAPPSSAKNPSLSGTSSRLPSVIEGARTSVAVDGCARRVAIGRRNGRSDALEDVLRGGVRVERARTDCVHDAGEGVWPERGVYPRHEPRCQELAQPELAPCATALAHACRRVPAKADDGLY